MNILTKNLLYCYKSKPNYGFWEFVTENRIWDEIYDIKYDSEYGCYTMYDYECELYYSYDLKTWNYISGDLVYNPINKHYYKVISSKVDDKFVISIAEMTSLNVFAEAVTLDSIDYNSYATSDIFNIYKLGNYYILPYSFYNRTGSGSSAIYNKCYQKIAYTKDFKTWNKSVIHSQTNADSANSQIRPIGSSGSKFVLFSENDEGFCPVVFSSPTNFKSLNALFTSGNMTADIGAYINGTWYFFENTNYPLYISTDGTTFTKCDSYDYWKNPYMVFYENQYITANSYTGELRVYDSSFTSYKDIQIPCEKVTRILGIMENQLYIYSSDYKIFRTDISNLIN